MEDAATAEISRSQIWQWIHNRVQLPTPARRSPRELVAPDRSTRRPSRLRGRGRPDRFERYYVPAKQLSPTCAWPTTSWTS